MSEEKYNEKKPFIIKIVVSRTFYLLFKFFFGTIKGLEQLALDVWFSMKSQLLS